MKQIGSDAVRNGKYWHEMMHAILGILPLGKSERQILPR